MDGSADSAGDEVVGVSLFDRLKPRNRRKNRPGSLRRAGSEDMSHLADWAGSRRGVEAYVEPRTAVTETSVVLVAHDGEWTRRRVGSLKAAQDFARKRSMPVYEAAKTGYPQRMRDYTERLKRRPDG